jgi:hypothetical protein
MRIITIAHDRPWHHFGLRATALLITTALALLWPRMSVPAMASKSYGQLYTLPAAGGPGGDIPDTAVYLRYTGRGLSIEYVEGWLQTTTMHGILFNDKDSAVAVELKPRLRESLSAYVQRVDLPRLAHTAGFKRGPLSRDSIGGYNSVRLSYRGRSEPDQVTGKTVALQIDRYYVNGPHALALITLSTPLGVDNIDAFRRIAHSFRFR